MTNEITNEELARLKELAEAATPGPWEATRQTDDECNFIGYFIEAGDKAISDDATAPDHADALHIAAANPAAILALIAKVESLAADAERWKKFERALRNGHIPGAAHGKRFKIIETCAMSGDEKEFNDLIGAIDAMAKEKA